jgi:hypothetical protein
MQSYKFNFIGRQQAIKACYLGIVKFDFVEECCNKNSVSGRSSRTK